MGARKGQEGYSVDAGERQPRGGRKAWMEAVGRLEEDSLKARGRQEGNSRKVGGRQSRGKRKAGGK
jgi:hypothetical protein